MNGHDLVRSVRAVGMVGAAQSLRTVRAAWRRQRADSAGLPRRGAEKARVPGPVTGVEPGPGGGVVRFARSELRVCVTGGGAVFWGWDGTGPEPSYALSGPRPEPDPRAFLEPDKDGGWRVVSERVMVVVSRHGTVEVRTPGGVVLRRDLPPRWWEPAGGGGARWVQ
ncbi:glycosyl hydrolase, partial [Streptomyces sp. YC504]|nr:glycosyl hydrolase [Streptomyces mesophilus]